MAAHKEMTQAITFGLGIPCKNGAPFLPRLFASIHAQTKPFDEIWLFDDGSEDSSRAIAASFGARVLSSPVSLGPSAARNRLITACSCEWLHFHDADDTMAPTYLERVAACVRPEIDLVVCNMLWIDEKTGRIENHWRYNAHAFARNPAAYLIVNTIGGINGLYRRSALLSAGAFDESLKFWEDTELNLRLAKHGAKADVVEEDLVTAYRRGASYSNSNLVNVWLVKLQLIDGLRSDPDQFLRQTIAIEAEAIANRLARLDAWSEIPHALKVASLAGGNPPTTNNWLLRVLKRILPLSWTFRLQVKIRRLLEK